MSTFKSGTGLGGYTEPGQVVTKENLHELPAGSVVRLPDKSRIIHLHDDTWLHCSDGSYLYGGCKDMERYIWTSGILCHMP